MTKYCPACESEYQDAVMTCPDDGEQLFDAPSVKIERNQAIDIYAASGEIEAKRIVAFLSDLGIASQLFRPQISQLPSLGDSHFVLAVRPADKAVAVEHIHNARNDEIISSQGLFL